MGKNKKVDWLQDREAARRGQTGALGNPGRNAVDASEESEGLGPGARGGVDRVRWHSD